MEAAIFPSKYITINHIAGLISRSHRSRTRPIFRSRSVSPRPSKHFQQREEPLDWVSLLFYRIRYPRRMVCATSLSCAYKSFHLSPAQKRKREDDCCGRKRKGRASERIIADIPIDRNRSANAWLRDPSADFGWKKRGCEFSTLTC